MTTITLEYNESNEAARKLIEYVRTLSFIRIGAEKGKVKKMTKKEIANIRVPGLACTHEELLADIEVAREDIRMGRTIPQAEIETMVKQWGRERRALR